MPGSRQCLQKSVCVCRIPEVRSHAAVQDSKTMC